MGGFENREPQGGVTIVPTPDFEANLKAYNDQVEQLSTQIKAKQDALAAIQSEIDAQNANLQASYTAKIQSFEDQITSLQAEIVQAQARFDALVQAIKDKQAQFDAISLDFTAKQKLLDDSWADFHLRANQLLIDQKRLKSDQDALLANRAQLIADQSDFENQKKFQQDYLDSLTKQASDAYTKAGQVLADALVKQTKADADVATVTATQADLASKLAAVQPILAQADAIAAQKVQNDADTKKNEALALQNQTDANEIKVARVALNNAQVDFNNRLQTLQQAEAALKTGGTP
jgi:chromosome segregation ATPase